MLIMKSRWWVEGVIFVIYNFMYVWNFSFNKKLNNKTETKKQLTWLLWCPILLFMTCAGKELKQLPGFHEWKPRVDLGRVTSALHLPALDYLPKGEIIIKLKPLGKFLNVVNLHDVPRNKIHTLNLRSPLSPLKPLRLNLRLHGTCTNRGPWNNSLPYSEYC